MSKWNFKRVLALVLAVVMIVSLPDLSAMTVWGAETEESIVEPTETNGGLNEESTIIYEEIVDLGTVETTAVGIGLFSNASLVSLKDGNHANWIDRIQVSEAGMAFYNALIEGSDNDGTADFLINSSYYTNNASNNVTFNYNDGSSETCNVQVYKTETNTANSFDTASVYAEMRAVFDAFDRDHPEVFWLSGGSSAACSISVTGSVYTATYYFILKNHSDLFDVRQDTYQDEVTLTTAISSRDTAIQTIKSGLIEGTTNVEMLEHFNNWLTKNNEYNTLVANKETGPSSAYECLSALTGSTGETGPVCEAYARAFKVLCDKVGIPCVLVDGNASSSASAAGEAHMWNYVQVDGAWYAVDVTWNDPVVSGKSGAESGCESTKWFLLGSTTTVGTDFTFIDSHPVSNQASVNGVCFTNGPVLNTIAYAQTLSPITSVTVNQTELTYGYSETATVTATLSDEKEATYQWYKKGEDGTETAVNEATVASLPTGLDAGTYFCRVSCEEYTKDSDAVIVKPKKLTVIATVADKTYDGNTTTTVVLSVSDAVNGEVVTATGTASFADANVGENKTVTVTNIKLSGNKVSNYYIEEETLTCTATILSKDISGATVALDKNALTYNGTEQTVNVTSVVLDGKPLATSDYTVSGNIATTVQENAYIVTVNGIGNYTGTVTVDYTMNYLSDDGIPVKFNDGEVSSNWYNQDVVITAEGYQISTSMNGGYEDSYTVSAEGSISDLKLYFRQNATGYLTDAVEVTEIKIDKTAPVFNGDNKGIVMSTNYWNTFLNTITFGLFFNETQNVNIVGTDSASGIDSYYYYIDNSGVLLTETNLAAKTFTALKDGDTFTIDPDGNYVIYAYAVDHAGNKSSYICSEGFVIDKTKPEISNVVEPSVDNGMLKDTSASITFTGSESCDYYYLVKEGSSSVNAADDIIAANNKATMTTDGTNKLEVAELTANTTYTLGIVAKDKAGNISEVKSVTFTTQKTLPTIITYPVISGTYGDTIGSMNITEGKVAGVDANVEITGSWAIKEDTSDIPEVGTTKSYIAVFTPTDTETYGSVSANITPIVAKKSIIVTADDQTKIFGSDNPTLTFTVSNDMLVGTDKKDDLAITLTTSVVKTSEVGIYDITGVSNAKNYNVTVEKGSFTITKATYTETIETVTKEYVYTVGTEGVSVTVDVGAFLPSGRGVTTYTGTVSGNLVTGFHTVDNDLIGYSVAAGSVGDTDSISITAQSKNYEDITFTIQIELVDKFSVSVQNAVITEGSLSYGDMLSKLTFGKVAFVDTNGTAVAGTIAWDTPSEKLSAGTHNVSWTFTPSNSNKYKSTTGTVIIEVAKATPSVTLPTTTAITYDSEQTLEEIVIVSGSTSVEGKWTWKDTSIVPTVGNSGYSAIFTPTDTANYNAVEKTVIVEVAKATPSVSAPKASAIIYGETLADAKLTASEDDVVKGSWAWKNTTIAPVVADSKTTEYEVVFTPADTVNYNTVTRKITLVVEKAEKPSNTPLGSMETEEEKVGDIKLPKGWEWTAEDEGLTIGRDGVVAATAVYTAVDAVNYKITEIEIKITLKQPAIYGEDGKEGWSAIEDEIKYTSKTEIKVDMKDTTKVDRNTLEILKEQDKTLILVLTDKDGKDYTWTIKGSDVKDGEFKNVQMSVTLFEKNERDKPEISDEVVNTVSKHGKHKFLSLDHDGDFGFKASLKLNVGKENAGNLATLYYYNPKTNTLDKTENVQIKIDETGNISLIFGHASDYVIVLEEDGMVTPPADANAESVIPNKSPKTSDFILGNVYFYITLLLLGAVAIYVGMRRRQVK